MAIDDETRRLARLVAAGDEAAANDLAGALHRAGYGGRRQQWEYRVVVHSAPVGQDAEQQLHAMLDEYGAEGWEMVNASVAVGAMSSLRLVFALRRLVSPLSEGNDVG